MNSVMPMNSLSYLEILTRMVRPKRTEIAMLKSKKKLRQRSKHLETVNGRLMMMVIAMPNLKPMEMSMHLVIPMPKQKPRWMNSEKYLVIPMHSEKRQPSHANSQSANLL